MPATHRKVLMPSMILCDCAACGVREEPGTPSREARSTSSSRRDGVGCGLGSFSDISRTPLGLLEHRRGLHLPLPGGSAEQLGEKRSQRFGRELANELA